MPAAPLRGTYQSSGSSKLTGLGEWDWRYQRDVGIDPPRELVSGQLAARDQPSEKVRHTRSEVCRHDHVEVGIPMGRYAEWLAAFPLAHIDSLDLQVTADGLYGKGAIVGILHVYLHPELLLIQPRVGKFDGFRRDRGSLQTGQCATSEKERDPCSLAQPAERHVRHFLHVRKPRAATLHLAEMSRHRTLALPGHRSAAAFILGAHRDLSEDEVASWNPRISIVPTRGMVDYRAGWN